MTDTPKASKREDQAMIELGSTTVSWPVKIFLVLAFLVIIGAVMLAEVVTAYVRGEGSLVPPGLRLSEVLPEVSGDLSLDRGPGVMAMVPTADDLKAFESRVEDSSLLRTLVLPPVQYVMTSVFGVGNEEAIAGSNGWLYYSPDIEYVTAGPFLSEARLSTYRRMREGGQDVPWPDPVRAIVDFRDQLRLRGIELVVLPTPVKPQIEPEWLGSTGRIRGDVLQNPSWSEFQNRLEQARVNVFDPAGLLIRGSSESASYLKTDTHWTPQAMQRVANALADYLHERYELPDPTNSLHAGIAETVLAEGDLTAMLMLPDPVAFYPDLQCVITPILTSDGQGIAPAHGAPVMLLGDSFTNIYSLESMGFGKGAGLAEHLSLSLGVSIDWIARNAGGASATREALAQHMAREQAMGQGIDRLAATKVVVWQFAMRELLSGDWKPVELPIDHGVGAGATPEQMVVAESGEAEGDIVQMTHAPNPRAVPYKDAVIALHLANVQGSGFPDEIVVYGLGLKDRTLTALNARATGDRVKLSLLEWGLVQSKYEGLNRVELDDPDFRLIELPLYWADEQ